MGLDLRFWGRPGAVLSAFTASLVALSLMGCSPQIVPTAPPVSAASSGAPLSTATQANSPPTGSAPPSATPVPSSSEPPQAVMPNPGGTCSADQFVVAGPPISGYGFGTFYFADAFFKQPLRNAGRACVLRLPGSIGVAGPDRRLIVVDAVNAGTATSFRVGVGKVVAIVLGAWWPRPGTSVASTWCRDLAPAATHATVPLAAGVIDLDLGITVPEVCLNPPSMSVTFQ
jgi:hypothetical protein